MSVERTDVEDLKKKFEDLTERRNQCNVKKIELEAKLGIARKDLEDKLDSLARDYGVSSVSDAESLLDQIGKELEEKIASCKEYLSKVEES